MRLSHWKTRQALTTLSIDVVVCLAMFLTTFYFISPEMIPETPVMQFIFSWRYLLLGGISFGIVAISLSRTNSSVRSLRTT